MDDSNELLEKRGGCLTPKIGQLLFFRFFRFFDPPEGCWPLLFHFGDLFGFGRHRAPTICRWNVGQSGNNGQNRPKSTNLDVVDFGLF